LSMYVGRIVVVGSSGGGPFVGYRVSSRSFPNRRAEVRGNSVLVAPLDPSDLARNPYIAYNCIRVWEDVAVVANGTQADMIAEKIEDGLKPLEAIGLSLLSYGYERDHLNTPRIAGAVQGSRAWLGIAAKEEFRVQEFQLKDRQARMVATYETVDFSTLALSGNSAKEIARSAFDLSFERPVCAAAAYLNPQGTGFELAVYNPD